MESWIVKGKPGRNDFAAMLRPGRKGLWITKKPPKAWMSGDMIFFWEGAPKLRVVGLGALEKVASPDADGVTVFRVRYYTAPFEKPIGIDELRRDRILKEASFLKAGAAGTVFPLSEEQSTQLMALLCRDNEQVMAELATELDGEGSEEPRPARKPRAKKAQPAPRAAERGASSTMLDGQQLALSIHQPWAELVMRGIKTIEVRVTPTHKRGRVHVYAGLGRSLDDAEVRAIAASHGLDLDALPRGVLVGSAEIVDCRPLRAEDTDAAGFPIEPGQEEGRFAWVLAKPRRAKMLERPTRQPQPIFFRPF